MQIRKDYVLWRDRYLPRVVILVLVVLYITGMTIIVYNNSAPLKLFHWISITFPFFFFGFITINILRIRLIFVTSQGISTGNMKEDFYEYIRPPKKTYFVNWRDIKKISIKSRRVQRPNYTTNVNRLLIKKKDSETYETFIAHPGEFIQIVKNLKKGHLISKESKIT